MKKKSIKFHEIDSNPEELPYLELKLVCEDR